MIDVQVPSHVMLLTRLATGQVYSTSRFGDGEWTAILGRNPAGRNCDGHQYYPQMGKELAQALRNRCGMPNGYWLGMQRHALRLMGPLIEAWREDHDPLHRLAWHDADTLAFHRASQLGQMAAVITTLRAQPILVVGPPHLEPFAAKTLGCRGFVTVPARNAYLQLAGIERQVRDLASRLPRPLVVSISCGMPAGILIDRLYPDLGRDCFLLDLGSVWDYYAGYDSRGYMRKMRKEGVHERGTAVADGPPTGGKAG